MRIRLDSPTAYGGKTVTHISTDTRELRSGDLFFPIRGRTHDGRAFTDEALALGAVIAKTSLADFASEYKSELENLRFTVGITGSVGKTTTKNFLSSILSQRYRVHATEGNFNNEVGLPLTILSAPRETEVLVLEMGMNHEGEIARLSRCARPDLAIITNVGSAHIGNLGSREKIAKAKLEIREGMKDGRLIVPYGEPLLMNSGAHMTFSAENELADVYVKRVNSQFADIFSGRNAFARANFSLRGEHLLSGLAAASCGAIALGLSSRELASGISEIGEDALRHRIIRLGDISILDDSYNASPESVYAALSLGGELPYSEKSVLLGSLGELGEYSEQIHYRIGAHVAKSNFRHLYLFGEPTEHTARGAIDSGFPRERIFLNPDLQNPERTADDIESGTVMGELLIFKASHATGLYRIIDILKKRKGEGYDG